MANPAKSWLYKEWDNLESAGFSGWDPWPSLVFWLEFLLVAAAMVSCYVREWPFMALFVTLAILHPCTTRYSLTLHPGGYRLRRFCFYFIPWRDQHFSKEAAVCIEDDWDCDQGLVIFEKHEDFSKGTTFSNANDCRLAMRHIGFLMERFGWVESPPISESEDATESVKVARAGRSRRLKYFSRRKLSDESK